MNERDAAPMTIEYKILDDGPELEAALNAAAADGWVLRKLLPAQPPVNTDGGRARFTSTAQSARLILERGGTGRAVG